MDRRTFMSSVGLGLGATLLTRPLTFAAGTGYDIVVYAGTPSGVLAAVAAARMGARVALLDPGAHLGGMVSSGLGWSDFGKKESIGGLPLEFFERVGRHYQEPVVWYFEPHVAEQVFQEMASEAKVEVFYHHRLKEQGGVRKDSGRITQVEAENGAIFSAPVFIDASYEGDLMAQAGVSFTWGREGQEEYNEPQAGVIAPSERHAGHRFLFPISAYDESGNLLPEISAAPRGEIGVGDKKVQAYNFRMCLTMQKDNQVPFPEPSHYDRKRYVLLQRLIEAMTNELVEPPYFKDFERASNSGRHYFLTKLNMVPNGKTDLNNNGAFSTDYIGGSWEYPAASYKRRAEIWQAHFDYVAGFFYFLSHDPQIPQTLREQVARWGLAQDEFTDNNNWPQQLYVREVRRMRGGYVMTQRDSDGEIFKDDVIGMGSYNLDSHNFQRYVTPERTVQNEGDLDQPVLPYQIAYRVLLPRPRSAGICWCRCAVPPPTSCMGLCAMNPP